MSVPAGVGLKLEMTLVTDEDDGGLVSWPVPGAGLEDPNSTEVAEGPDDVGSNESLYAGFAASRGSSMVVIPAPILPGLVGGRRPPTFGLPAVS